MLVISATPSATNFKVPTGQQAKFALLNLKVEETDTSLSQRFISASLNWGNGLPTVYLGSQTPATAPVAVVSPINITSLTTSYYPGTYLVVITARNYREPVYDQVQKVIEVQVDAELSDTPALGKLVGPILPRDVGYPNAEQWNFNTGENTLVLESNLRNILLTARGERLMFPDFGTNLRAILFEPETPAVETMVRDEVVKAVAKYEPRVELDRIQVKRAPKQVELNISFISKLNSQPFQVSVKYER
jgi:phage baseplate assembly protein W